MLRVLLVTLLAMTLHGYQSVRPDQIERLYGPSPRDLGLYLVRVAPSVPGPRTRRRWVRTGELGRALFAAPASCPACEHTPGVLWPVNGGEVQCCDGCAPPHWSDDDAVRALRERLPWLAVEWQPDEDEDGQVPDPAIGVWVIDLERTVVPADAPPWARGVIQAMGED